MKKIIYVTGNWAKIESAKQALEPLGFEIENIKMDTLEIQADTAAEVAAFSAKYASDRLKCDVLKNDSGIYVDALKVFPGPYTHYADDTIGEDGLLKLMQNETNRKARFIESYAYCEYGKEPVIFESVTHGTIAYEKSGTYGWSWDFVFIPDGQTKTMGCFPDDERWKLFSREGLFKLAEYLKNKE